METEQFIFYKGVDCGEHDAYRIQNATPELLQHVASLDKNIVAYNTLGFMKSYVDFDRLVPSQYFGSTDGIYIKRSFVPKRTKKIQFHSDINSSSELCKKYSTLFDPEEIEVVEDNGDYHVVINYPSSEYFWATDTFTLKNTIVFQLESSKERKTWGRWSEPRDKNGTPLPVYPLLYLPEEDSFSKQIVVIIEDEVEENYVSNAFWTALVSECYIVYYGAPNILDIIGGYKNAIYRLETKPNPEIMDNVILEAKTKVEKEYTKIQKEIVLAKTFVQKNLSLQHYVSISFV